MAYLRPDTLEAALTALGEAPMRVAAGCTDLFPATETRALTGDILDITAIPGLARISESSAGWRLGAATTWAEIARADLPPAFQGLQLAAREVGARQIQARGTLGGNLCNASPAADGVPPLLTLGAEVELAALGGARRLPLAAFITGPRATALRPDEVLVAVHIPARAARGQGQFQKLGARRYLVISIAMAAVRVVIDRGRVAEAALSIGACGPVAVRLPALEAQMIGQHPAEVEIETRAVADALAPIDDIRADAAYRREAAAEMLRRAWDAACRDAAMPA